jgi:hypothetical protein
MADIINEREQEIIDLVVKALPQHFIAAKPMMVHTLEGGESATLRFTADESSSTDLKRERIAGEGVSVEQLAQEVENRLKMQLGYVRS